MDSILKIKDLSVVYDTKPVLWDIDVSFKPYCRTAIIGPNGAGKSTLIKAIMKLIKPITGTIQFNQTIKKNQIAYVPQSESVDWDFPATVFEIVMMGRYGHLGWCRHPKRSDRVMVNTMIEKVGLTPFKNRQIKQLSGGQQQRVFLARALVQEANLYILDEPLKGVDSITEKIIMDLLKELTLQQKTIIAVHHDLATLDRYFDEVIGLNINVKANCPVSQLTPEIINKIYGKPNEAKYV